MASTVTGKIEIMSNNQIIFSGICSAINLPDFQKFPLIKYSTEFFLKHATELFKDLVTELLTPQEETKH